MTHMVGNDGSSNKGGTPIRVPNGTIISALVRGIINNKNGSTVEELAKEANISLHVFEKVRDMVLLLDMDLNTEDYHIVKEALEEVDRTLFVKQPWDRIKPITIKIWGRKGLRQKTDKKRMKRFEDSISMLLGTCESMTHVVIPYMAKEQRKLVLQKICEAERALSQFLMRVKEGE